MFLFVIGEGGEFVVLGVFVGYFECCDCVLVLDCFLFVVVGVCIFGDC